MRPHLPVSTLNKAKVERVTEPTDLTDHGRTLAVLVPVDWYRRAASHVPTPWLGLVGTHSDHD